MRASQIVAVIFGALLLLPGGCCLFFGAMFVGDTGGMDFSGLGTMLLLIAAAILGVAGLLFWLAFRKRPPLPDSGLGPPPAAPPA